MQSLGANKRTNKRRERKKRRKILKRRSQQQQSHFCQAKSTAVVVAGMRQEKLQQVHNFSYSYDTGQPDSARRQSIISSVSGGVLLALSYFQVLSLPKWLPSQECACVCAFEQFKTLHSTISVEEWKVPYRKERHHTCGGGASATRQAEGPLLSPLSLTCSFACKVHHPLSLSLSNRTKIITQS